MPPPDMVFVDVIVTAVLLFVEMVLLLVLLLLLLLLALASFLMRTSFNTWSNPCTNSSCSIVAWKEREIDDSW